MAMQAGMHEALAAIAGLPADDDPRDALAALLASLREAEQRQAGSGVAALCHFLDHYPAFRQALRRLLCRLLGDATAPHVYAGTGILANTGFGTELARRLIGKILPPPRDASLRGQFQALFVDDEDRAWLAAVPMDNWLALVGALRFAGDDACPGGGDGRAPLREALVEALDILSVRVAAVGVEPELLRHYHVPRAHNNPFLAQNAEVQRWLEATRGGETADARQLEVLLAQCAGVADQVRRAAHRDGASFRLTFVLRRLAQLLARMRTIIGLLAARDDDAPAAVRARVAFALELVLAEIDDHGVRDHLRDGSELVALQVTEHASRTGEHYVTVDRREYVAMFRAALGAGGIIGVMALVKTLLAGLHLPPLVEGLAFGLNYALGFVLIYLLHFTIATKQPAMTAQTIAAQLASGRRSDVDAVALLVSRVARTQFIAVLGNVLLAMPVALLVTLLAVWLGAVSPAAKAPVLIGDLHVLASPALFHAAIAGFWLFCSGLLSGYVDNLAAYERLAERVRAMRSLRALGEDRHRRLAHWLEDNVGGIAGNLFFGFALGLTGFVGLILGLPLDIRHVTFAAANLAIGWVGSGMALPAGVIAVSLLGVVLIAAVNVAVSFALALWLALRARGRGFGNLPALVAALWRRFRLAPLAFVVPPRREKQADD